MVDDRRLRSALGIASGALFLAVEGRALADTRPLTDAIRVEPGATCVDAGELAGDVASWLRTDRVDAEVWVEVEGSPDDSRVAWFAMGRGTTTLARRRFDPGPDRCDHLEAMLGLAIALAIKVSLVDEIAGRAVSEGSVPSSPSPPWAVAGDALLALGVVPGFSAGLELHAARAFPPNFVVRAGVLGLAGGGATFDRVAGAFDAELVALRADACVEQATRAGNRALYVGGCSGIVAGDLLLQGHGFPSSESAAAPWAAIATGVNAAIDLDARRLNDASVGVSIEAQVTVVLPLGHTTVGAVSSTGLVADSREVASVGVMMAVGPSFRF